MKNIKNSLLVYSLIVSFLLMSASIVFSDSENPADDPSATLAEQLHQHYQQIESLSFSFIQTTRGPMSGRPKTGRGTGIFAKTAQGTKMRWNYNSPERQVLISDGSTISMYFEKLNQMIIAPVDPAQADILFSFFAGNGPLTDNFTILSAIIELPLDSNERENDLKLIRLAPKNPDSQVQTILLWLTSDLLIRRIELIDHFDTRTTINLSDIIINPYAKDDSKSISNLFSFTPPKGTEIINQ